MARARPGGCSTAPAPGDLRTDGLRCLVFGERQRPGRVMHLEDLDGRRPCRALRNATRDRGPVLRLRRKGCRKVEIARGGALLWDDSSTGGGYRAPNKT